VSYQFFDIHDVKFIIIFISRDTAQEVGGSSTVLFILYAQFRYPSSCFDGAECKNLFQNQIQSTIESPKIRNIAVPLIGGQILSFQALVSSLTKSYQGGEYERYVNFLRKDLDYRDRIFLNCRKFF
jgi:hypothetical protein